MAKRQSKKAKSTKKPASRRQTAKPKKHGKTDKARKNTRKNEGSSQGGDDDFVSPFSFPMAPNPIAERDASIQQIAQVHARAWEERGLKAEQIAFLCAFAHVRNAMRAALIVGICVRTHHNWQKDEAYAECFAEAKEIGDQSLIDAATRRARDGIDKPVYQMGILAGYERVYSDSLLQMLLKGAMPDTFKDRTEHSGSIAQPGATGPRPLAKLDDEELAALEQLADKDPATLTPAERLAVRAATHIHAGDQ